MRRRRLYSLLIGIPVLAVLGLILAFVVVPGISKYIKSTAPPIVTSVSDSPVESVSVHGHWTIEVMNPDGTLADRREFDNAFYTTSGREFLVRLLARQTSVGGWSIRLLGNPTSQGAFPDESGARTFGGIIAESTSLETLPNLFKTLTVSAPTSGDNAGKLVLSGTATAQVDGNIGFVQTTIWGLRATEAPSASYAIDSHDPGYVFTGTTISSVPLTAGQQVLVTVVISFS
jgi:hypothetical protein